MHVTANEEGRVTEVAAPSPATTQRASVAGSVNMEDSAALARRQVAAFLTTMFLDDLVASVRLARQRVAGSLVCHEDEPC